ncbi:HNH endonuclease [Elusimicrobiota bacterium]
MTADLDHRVRLAAFAFLTEQRQLHGEVLDRTLLQKGFEFDGRRVPLMGPQGIFKPAILPEMPLSITTVPVIHNQPRPYEDEVGPDGLLRYRYRGQDPQHRENVGLRRAMQTRTPLIYNFGVVKGRYMPVWPVFVTSDNPASLTFSVAIDDAKSLAMDAAVNAEQGVDARRQYVTGLVRHRLHQRAFRDRVLDAYREQCAICRLKHEELLDAAHILPDSHPKGDPIVPNGLALCKLHHAAFDRNILGIRPDLKVEIRLDVLNEEDGPMLRYGLQGFNGALLKVPRVKGLRPDPEFLGERYDIFRQGQPGI